MKVKNMNISLILVHGSLEIRLLVFNPILIGLFLSNIGGGGVFPHPPLPPMILPLELG